jgi:hypothetical protein
MQLAAYNYDTKSYDYLETLPYDSVESMLPYAPDRPTEAARSLFRLYVEYKGMSVADAYLEVLTRCVGER